MTSKTEFAHLQRWIVTIGHSCVQSMIRKMNLCHNLSGEKRGDQQRSETCQLTPSRATLICRDSRAALARCVM